MTRFFTGGAFAALREGFARYKIGEESVFCKFCRAVFFVEYRLKPSLYMAEIGSTRTDNPIDFSNFEPIKLSYMTQELKFFPRWSFLKYIPRIHKLNLQSKLESLFKFSRSIFFYECGSYCSYFPSLDVSTVSILTLSTYRVPPDICCADLHAFLNPHCLLLHCFIVADASRC